MDVGHEMAVATDPGHDALCGVAPAPCRNGDVAIGGPAAAWHRLEKRTRGNEVKFPLVRTHAAEPIESEVEEGERLHFVHNMDTDRAARALLGSGEMSSAPVGAA